MSKNKVTFTVKVEDKSVEYCVKKPDHKINRDAQGVYAKTWRECAESGNYILREGLKKILRDAKLWDIEKDKQYLDLNTKIRAAELAIKSGGKKLSEVKNIAIDLAGYRVSLQELLMETSKYDENTAESQAENARFDYLVSKCVLDPSKDGATVFESYEDYLARKSEPVASIGANELAKMLYGVDAEFQKKLPENEFLLKHGFIDEKLRFINKEGKLTDRQGRLINENGRYIDKDGKFVNANGELVDEQGEMVVEFKPFLPEDDEVSV